MRTIFIRRITLLLLGVFGTPALLGQGLHWVVDHGHSHSVTDSEATRCQHECAAHPPTDGDEGPSTSGLSGECEICRFLATSKQPGKITTACLGARRLRFAEPTVDVMTVFNPVDFSFAPRGPPCFC